MAGCASPWPVRSCHNVRAARALPVGSGPAVHRFEVRQQLHRRVFGMETILVEPRYIIPFDPAKDKRYKYSSGLKQDEKYRDTKTQRHKRRASKAFLQRAFVPPCLCVSVFFFRQEGRRSKPTSFYLTEKVVTVDPSFSITQAIAIRQG